MKMTVLRNKVPSNLDAPLVPGLRLGTQNHLVGIRHATNLGFRQHDLGLIFDRSSLHFLFAPRLGLAALPPWPERFACRLPPGQPASSTDVITDINISDVDDTISYAV